MTLLRLSAALAALVLAAGACSADEPATDAAAPASTATSDPSPTPAEPTTKAGKSHTHDPDDPHKVRFDSARGRARTSAGPGDHIVFGTTVLVNEGDTPATLIEAELVGEVPASAVEVVDARVHEGAVAAGPWPNDHSHDAVPLDGYELAPGAEVAVLLVLEVHEAGRWTWPKVAVDYTSADGERHQITCRHGLRIGPA